MPRKSESIINTILKDLESKKESVVEAQPLVPFLKAKRVRKPSPKIEAKEKEVKEPEPMEVSAVKPEQKAKKNNGWLKHVSEYKAAHPDVTHKAALVAAKDSYKK